MPLAIELAAARLPGTTIAELAGNLDDRFGLLTAGHRADRRHHSLRAVVDWSYQQLLPAEQRLFRQLSVFRGWFDASAAREAAGANSIPRVLDLVDRSLVTADRDGGVTRYRLLETLRDYGRARLAERGELDAAHARHARWAAGLVTRAAGGLRGADEADWAARLDRHLDDLRAAHGWLAGHDPALGLQLTAGLHWFALWRCHSEVFRWADVSAAAAAGSSSPFYPGALASAALGAVYRGDLHAADTAARSAFAAARPLQIRSRPAGRWRRSATSPSSAANSNAPPACTARLTTCRPTPATTSTPRGMRASAAAALGYGNRLDEAHRLARQAQRAAEASGAPSALALAAWVMGENTAGSDPGLARPHLLRQ